jgi:hypothetical protein
MPRKPRTKNRSGAGDSKRRDRGTCPPVLACFYNKKYNERKGNRRIVWNGPV